MSVLKFNVDLGPLQARSTGEEVSVWFKDQNLNNSGVFYTDSNSLEMEERNVRELQRPDQTYAGNMYPITSAIAMRDFKGSNTQVTIMNDRAQAGAADVSDANTIELI